MKVPSSPDASETISILPGRVFKGIFKDGRTCPCGGSSFMFQVFQGELIAEWCIACYDERGFPKPGALS